jgi:ribA/ribD-fused uncharacterized protein
MAFRTREEIEAGRPAFEAKQRQAALADLAKRDESSRKRVVITLDEAPNERYAGNHAIVSFRGSEAGRSSLAAVYFKPDLETPSRSSEGADDLDARLRDLRKGDKVTLAGYWGKRKWQGQDGVEREAWEFKVQNFEKGDVSIDAISKSAAARIDRIRPEGVAPAPEPEDEIDRDLRRMLADGGMGKPPASPRLTYASGNVVDDGSQVLVNTVNSQLSQHGNGVMGKGVALAFKEAFPSIMKDYETAIRSGELKPGRALLFDLPDGRKWAALATKDHFSQPSKEEWVESGLKELGEKMRAAGLTSVALPPPGCGNGGLDWKKVEPLVHKHLEGVDVAMFAKPSGAMDPAPEILPPLKPMARASEAREPVSTAQEQAELPGMSRNARALAALDSGRAAPASSKNARALAALDAGRGGSAEASPAKSGSDKDDLIARIPELLGADGGYRPYAGIGSRETPQDVCDDMTAIARVLEARGHTLRSGFAKAADTAFELGTTRDDLREIFAPWKGFGADPNSKYDKDRWEQIYRHERITGKPFTPAKAHMLTGQIERQAAEMASKHHPKWDEMGNGPRMLHTRNMGQVYGPRLDQPARFEMAFTVDGKASGGTGQAIRVAESAGIPVLNLHDQRIRAAVLKELGLEPQRDLAKDLAAAERARAEGVGGRASEPARAPAPEVQASHAASKEFDLSIPPVRTRARDEVASFCKTADPLGGLAMMSRDHPYEDQGLKWKSSEAHFQAAKFPHNPDLQEQIRLAENGFEAKKIAWAHKDEVRPDWRDINAQMLAYVNTRKMDGSQSFRDQLASTEGRDIVELSVKDDFFGAKPVGDKLVGRDLLGHVLTQLRDGARMDELPPGTSFPGASKGVDREAELPDPSIKASMYFKYGRDRRPDFQSESTFEAILAGERTSTTRYKEWGGMERWESLKPGSIARFYEDKDMRGKSVDVVVLSTERVSLRDMDAQRLEDWSRVEGWSVEHARASARKYTEGVQIRYALPDSPEGREALALSRGGPTEAVRESASPERPAPVRQAEPVRQNRSPAVQAAQMTAKDRWLASLG